MTHHLVGMAEIAEMLGVSRQRVGQLVEAYEDFPKPEVELTGGRVWSRTAVETWIHTHPDRGPGRPERSKGRLSSLIGRKSGGLFTRFTDLARVSVVKGQEEARLLKHDYIGTEHLLLGLLATGEGVAHEVLQKSGVTLEAVRSSVSEMIGEGTEAPRGHIPFTPRAKKVLELALREALHLGHNYIGTEHVLLGIMREGEGVAWQVLTQYGLKAKSLRASIVETLEGRGLTGKPAAIGSRPLSPDEDTCAFCGKRRDEVKALVAGPGPIRICDDCVQNANQIVREAVGESAVELRLADLEQRLRSLEEDDDS